METVKIRSQPSLQRKIMADDKVKKAKKPSTKKKSGSPEIAMAGGSGKTKKQTA